MRISVIQMNQGSDKQANLDQARRLIEGAMASDRPDLISLPETWTNLGGGREAREAAAEILPEPGGTGGVAYEFLRSVAVAHGITVHGGSMIERGPEKLFNTTLVFDRSGAEIARYRKIHLFDITGPDGTGYRESALYGAGDRLVTCQIGGVTLGLTICYDMRFAEQYMALRRMGAEVIFVPSNFTLQTGKDHWEVMLRSRAIESQCWIAAAASWGGYDERGATRFVYMQKWRAANDHHFYGKPDCSRATRVPSMTRRTARSATPLDCGRRLSCLVSESTEASEWLGRT